jgi:hypothetical protein
MSGCLRAGGGAALWAAAELGPEVAAVVSRGGRPDLALPVLPSVTCPVLLLVGGEDHQVVEMNRWVGGWEWGRRLAAVCLACVGEWVNATEGGGRGSGGGGISCVWLLVQAASTKCLGRHFPVMQQHAAMARQCCPCQKAPHPYQCQASTSSICTCPLCCQPRCRRAAAQLRRGQLVLVPGATHLFEEPGTLEAVAQQAAAFFRQSFTAEAAG